MPQLIRIAISGGGLAGASLMQALLQYPHLDVHIFESASAFKESGLAIGITRNAQAPLDLLGPPAPQLLRRAGAVPMQGVRFMIAEGEGTEQVIDEVDNSKGTRLTSIIHRAAYLQQLLADVPEDRQHSSKKLEKIDHKADGSVTMHFADGTTHDCDILIGADGIHSTVRKFVLGDDPAASPRNTGLWIVMARQSYEKARARAALKAYDQVRRPRTQRIVESSRDTGMMLIGKGGQTGMEMKEAGSLLPRWDFILDLDMLEHRNEALQKMLDELAVSA
ncbi:hypothetical protein F5Y03DRAFT_279304 [Xylaria venustula]|nr:hypothetical protein F5Y03DRAFT_279304 [Xylaria venustula]